MVSSEIFIDITLPAAYGPGDHSASNRNEYQEYFLGVKAAGADNHLHVPIVLKSGSLNLLEPSAPAQACKGIALPLLNMNISWHNRLSKIIYNERSYIEIQWILVFSQ